LSRSLPALPSEQEIPVFVTRTPECDYLEVGLVRGQRSSRFDSMQDVVDVMRRHAREMGGEAIIWLAPRTTTSRSTAGMINGVPVEVENNTSVLTGVVVRFNGVCPQPR
jgi:hypothetical protein